MSKSKILFTGGHAMTPALAVIEQFKKHNNESDLYWIGPHSAMEGRKVTTAAEKTLGVYGVKVKKIIAGRAKKKGDTRSIIMAYLKIPIGFIHAFGYVARIRPNVVVSFGGFAAVPVVFSAWILRKPIIIHEQIVGAGLGNRLSAPFATKILLARTESKQVFPSKAEVIGNPQIETIFSVKPKTKIGNPPVLFITGGSSGAQTINRVVADSLEILLTEFMIVHQAGDVGIDELIAKKEALPLSMKEKYEVFSYLPPHQFVKYFQICDIIVSRAGANTVSDIVNTARPAILIPIPWSINDEQSKNALKAAKTGIAVVLEQDNLSAATLIEKIAQVKNNWSKMINNIDPGDYQKDKLAAERMYKTVLSFLP